MKKFKWIFGILLVLVLAVGGVALYFLKFKEYDVADESVDEVLEEGFELELPDGSVVVVDKDGNVLEELTGPTETTVNELPEGTTVTKDGQLELPDGSVIENTTNLPEGAVINANGKATLPDGTIVDVVKKDETPENPVASAGNGETSGNNDSTTNGGTNSNNDSTTNSGTNSETGNEGSANNDSTNDNTSDGSGVGEKTSVSDIKNKYAGSFAALESQATAKLNGLIGTAKSEYSTAKANGESVSYPYYYQKYYGAAQSLESNTDNAFNALLNIVKSDLQKNGFDVSYADSFVTEYNAAKKAREASLIAQVKAQF